MTSSSTTKADTVPMADAPFDPVEPIRMGDRVGRYVLVDRLGEGGMGVVYAAHDPELERTVALKVLREGASDTRADHGARLLREARAMARVVHPNVVAVFDAGLHGERIFIAMERVDGMTLRRWLREEPRTWADIVHVFVQAGRGLAAAHAAGFVHRDFKPENVLIGKDGRVRVTDFGLAREPVVTPSLERHVHDSSTERPIELARSIAFGTPAYMAPEQLRFEHADARSDQFGFAVALFEGLYGQRPFFGTNLLALRESITHGEIREAPKGNRTPRWLRRVLLRALSSEREERYESMDALLEALGRNPYARWRRRGFFLGWALALGIGLWGVQQIKAAPEPRCRDAADKLASVWSEPRKHAMHEAFAATKLPYAEHTFDAVSRALDGYARDWAAGRTDACEATWVRGEQSAERLDSRMACLDERLNEARALTDVYTSADAKTVENAVAAAQSLPAPAQCSNAKVMARGAPPPPEPAKAAPADALKRKLAAIRALREAGHIKEAMAAAEPAVTAALALGYGPLEAQALYVHAELMTTSGAVPKDVEAALYRAAWAADRAHDDETRALAWIKLIFIVGLRQQRANDVALLNGQAIAAIERAGGQDELEFLRRRALSSVFRDQGRHEEARLEAAAALALAESHYGKESRQAGGCLIEIGWNLMKLGEHGAAMEPLQRGLATMESALGPTHPETAVAVNAMGSALYSQKRWSESVVYAERAAVIAENAYGAVHPDLAAYLDNWGETLSDQGKHSEALALHTRALGIYEQLYGPDHSETVSSLTAIGRTRIRSGDPLSARASLERALRLCGEGTDPLIRADVQALLAETLGPTERARARTLATTARQAYLVNPLANTTELEAIDRWLKLHPAQPASIANNAH